MKLENFIYATYESTAQEVDTENCVNLQPERTESPGAKAPLVLYGSPGTSLYNDFADGGPLRGELQLEGYSYFVSNAFLYRQDPDGNYLTLGAVGNDGLPVQFAASTTEFMVLSAGFAFVVSGTTITPVPSPPWTTPVDIAYLDGYYIVLDDDGSTLGGLIFIAVDPLVWDPLDFSNAPASNNKLRALLVDHEELLIFGSVVTQPFFNNGNADFPFVPNLSGVIQQGIESKETRCQLDNTVFWLGRSKDGHLQAFYAEGYTPHRFSTHAEEQQWQRYAVTSDAVAWTYVLDGHAMYHINFISAKKSWRYDRSTGLWHKVAYRNPVTNQDECHRGNNHIVRNGVHLIGDRESGKVWILSPTVYKDGDDPLVALRRSPAQNQENKNIFYPIFELITPGGIGDGTENTPESNPAWMLQWSNNNGRTFGPEFQLVAGRQGEYETRLRKIGCGCGRNRVWQVSISAAVPRCLIGAEIPGAYVGTS